MKIHEKLETVDIAFSGQDDIIGYLTYILTGLLDPQDAWCYVHGKLGFWKAPEVSGEKIHINDRLFHAPNIP